MSRFVELDRRRRLEVLCEEEQLIARMLYADARYSLRMCDKLSAKVYQTYAAKHAKEALEQLMQLIRD
jgi:hypothetical protein